MSIFHAATRPTVADAAYAYLEADCSIIPVVGKRPALPWDEFKRVRPSAPRVGFWLRSGRMRGIGLVCGAVSGGLVVIDVDSRAACNEFESAFPALLDTLTVISGSGRGKHYYFRCTGVMPANAWRNGIELRADGAYVVAPPSLHPQSCLAYCVDRPFEVKAVASLETVRRWIIDRGGGDTPIPAPRPTPAPTIRDGSRYGRAALAEETRAVALASEGEGNNRLYRAALKLGSLVAAGHLIQSDVERALEAAAAGLSARDGVDATRRTIASAFKVSLSSPRTVR